MRRLVPTESRLRALARSSPWRWTTLHLRVHEGFDVQEAWVDRDSGQTQLRQRDGRMRTERVDDGRATTVLAVAVGPDLAEAPAPEPGPVLTLDEDGLVAVRPHWFDLPELDAMVENYQWVAMLDPHELAAGTAVSEVRGEQRRGRETWRGVFEALPDYDPRCGCCPLLWSEHSDRLENPEGWVPTATYPTAYDVALDVQTGVVVEVVPIGADVAHTRLDVELLAVDEDAKVSQRR